METCEVIDDFFGVYLLYCLNPKYKGRTYIGYTRNPIRRIRQHNRGTWAGGAWRTNNKGPWKMVLIVHGFPNNISALRFEWAWQNPLKTTRLQQVANLKKIPRKETEFQYKLRILAEMLNVGPWNRLPLTMRWLEKEYYQEFPNGRVPPSHITTCYGPIKTRNLDKKSQKIIESHLECLICSNYIHNMKTKITCMNTKCELVCHISCLADLFLKPDDYIPIEGRCPFCDSTLKWGDLIRKMNGCSIGEVVEANNDNLESSGDDEDVIVSSQEKSMNENYVWSP